VQYGNARFGLNGSANGRMTSRFSHGASAILAAMGLAVGSQRVAVQKMYDFLHHRG